VRAMWRSQERDSLSDTMLKAVEANLAAGESGSLVSKELLAAAQIDRQVFLTS
jgi:hypothetical protein